MAYPHRPRPGSGYGKRRHRRTTARWMAPEGEDVSHQQISSYFIGPRAENLDIFKENIDVILEEIRQARVNYFPDREGENEFITAATKGSPAFIEAKERLAKAVAMAGKLMGSHSIPFWSPRYQAHMCTDMSMPSLLGYFMTMIYNPNNVALEASPLTTVAEIEVGEQLCDMFGYNAHEGDSSKPTAWGHITCDGSVANLESIWAARNLKFYPLSLRQAFDEDGPLAFLSSRFQVETCAGERKLFAELTTWELLNIKPTDVLDLPDRLRHEHGISNEFLSATMNQYTVQSTGKDVLERAYGIDQPCQYMLATSRHYSWPKGAAIAGLGSDNVVGIPVDHAARVDIAALDAALGRSLENRQAVFAVVGIVGSTEEGAVDSISSILALRRRYQARGLSFVVHADAAWGGYFCSMLPRHYHPGDVLSLPADTTVGAGAGFVPETSLRVETQEDLYAMRFVDSITVDPHKAGYIPYPAGGLCYRDGRMRFLVTWTSPYIQGGAVTSIGIFGVEGSKPGASAMSTWLSNKTIGLTQEGYGTLLGEVTWTCTRLSAEWAALTDHTSPFICVPFNMLPSELGPDPTPEKIEAEKGRIRREIVEKSNRQIVLDDAARPEDQKAMTLMRALGSDLNINAFALNFRYSDGRLNDDVEEANYLMRRVIERLSVESPDDDPTTIPLYLTSTEFSDELYGDCKRTFMDRLGLAQSTEDLMVLRNVVMSPFPTDHDFIHKLAAVLYDTAAEATAVVRRRNEVTEAYYSFLLQGTDSLYAVHLPMFHVANHRQQLVLSIALGGDHRCSALERYIEMKRSNPHEPMILVTAEKVLLQQIVSETGSFLANIITKEAGLIVRNVRVQIKSVVVSRPLNSKWRLPNYPAKSMPFYLYGCPTNANIDHILVRAPNTQLSASGCTLELESGVSADSAWWGRTHILVFDKVYEAPMQPFPANSEIGTKDGAILPHCGNFFFRPGARFHVSVYEDEQPDDLGSPGPSFELGEPVSKGTVVLGDAVYVDSEAMNRDSDKKVDRVSEWRREFDRIGKSME